MSERRAQAVAAGLALAALAAVAYVPLFAVHAGFIWDDDSYVTDNPTLVGARGLRDIWLVPGATPQYYPLVFTSFWIERRAWGLEPAGYHAVNVALHALAAVLVWRVLRRLGLRGAWLAAAIFAVHPVHVESVAWITERKNVLSGVFYLAALLAYPETPAWGEPGSRSPSIRRYALCSLLYLAALLSKTVTASLPVAILLLAWMKRGRLGRRDIVPVVPLLAVGAAFGLATAWLEKHSVGASGAVWDLSLWDRVLVAGRALWFYLGKLLWPAKLAFVYPRWSIAASRAELWVFPLAALGVAAVLWVWRERLGRGPLVAALFFAATLFPALGFLDVYPFRYSFVADHFQYLASLGPIALVSEVGVRLVHRSGLAGRRAGLGAATVVVAALALTTGSQCRIYRDVETLWRDTLAKNPRSWLAHNNLGQMLYERGQIEDALEHLEEAARINPDYPETQFNLGVLLGRQGRGDEAERLLRRAIELEPGYSKAHEQLGLQLFERGETREALDHLRSAVRLAPFRSAARWNLAVALSRVGRVAEGLDELREAVRLDPGNVPLRLGLAGALERSGSLAEAAAEFETSARLDPSSAAAREGSARCRARLGSAGSARP